MTSARRATAVTPERAALLYGAVLAAFAVLVSDPEAGLRLFRGIFIQDGDEIIRAWYGRCSWDNPAIIPFSHLSMPGWTGLLALGEGVARLTGLPLTLLGRWTTAAFATVALHAAASLARRVAPQNAERAAWLAVLLLGASPGFFLLSLTVYPEVALLALILLGTRLLLDGHPLRAMLAFGPMPLIRWEGALVLIPVVLYILWSGTPWRARLKGLAILVAPYALYLAAVAIRWGNPWTPLAWRTTKAMGAWRLWNPEVPSELLSAAANSLFTLYSPGVWLLGLVAAASAVGASRHAATRAILIPALAFFGLTALLFSVQHDFMVWPLRVFVVPAGLAAVLIAARFGPALQSVAGVAVALSVGMTASAIADVKLPAPGRSVDHLGFHATIGWADAEDALTWTLNQPPESGWVLINHMNANLLRADTTCRLWDKDLWIGGPQLALSRRFEPTFGLPPGPGLVVFHTLAFKTDHCIEAARFPSGQTVMRCPAMGGDSAVTTEVPVR